MMVLVASVAAVTGASLAVFCLLVWRAPGESYPGQFDRSAPESKNGPVAAATGDEQ